MSAQMMVDATSDVFFTPLCGIYRWKESMVTRAGTYLVVWLGEVYDCIMFARMKASDDGSIHPTCVVDDFGSLVKVPA